MSDFSCLADNYIVPADFDKTGVNLNEIIVGPTGCGKSMSNAYSRLLYTENSSVVVPITKKAIRKKFSRMFIDRGYEVINLDFANPDNADIGYDPLDYVKTDEDVVCMAKNLIYLSNSSKKESEKDPYWNNSATSVLSAEINLVRLNAKAAGREPSFKDVLKLHQTIRNLGGDNRFKTNIDFLFDEAEERYPGNPASKQWKTIRGLAATTASCIMSIVNAAVDKMFSESVVKMVGKENKIDFRDLGKRKIALFVTTSPMNKTLENLVNIMYSDMFRALFEEAEENLSGRLNVPVHIICDDFATGSKINDFEEYISIFRAAGISVTLLIQSETQLSTLYGSDEATTIINNCDTYVYMGGMDIKTCQNISQRIDKPLKKVLSMPLEQVIVFRRGQDPVTSRRFQILDDPIYQKVMSDNEIKTLAM